MRAAGTDQVAPDLGRDEVLARFHVRSGDGVLHCGARGFAELCSNTPGLRCLGRLVRWSVLSRLAELAYRAYLRVRPLIVGPVRRADLPQPRNVNLKRLSP